MLFFGRRYAISSISDNEKDLYQKPGILAASSAGPETLSATSADEGSLVERPAPALAAPGPASAASAASAQPPDRCMVLSHGNPNRPEVALTFDDGPGQYTSQVVALLQSYGVLATFFSIGQHTRQFSAALQEASAGGHAIGNHTLTHPHLTTLSPAATFRELKEAQDAIFEAGGTRPGLFRPPYGEYNAQVLMAARQLGLTVVTWSAAANDWNDPQPSADVIASRILSAAENGAIFLLHEGGGNRANTVASLPAIITGLQARGLHLVTLPQMQAHLSQ